VHRAILLPLLATILAAASAAAAPPALTVHADARALAPGELVALTIGTGEPVAGVHVQVFGRDWPAFQLDPTTWRALVGIDLDTAARAYRAAITTTAAGPRTTYTLAVVRKAFRTRRLTLDEAFVNPPAGVQDRIVAEARELAALWTSSAPERLWDGPFVRPVPQAANSAFGTRSILNGSPRSPHSGADFASPSGTPIAAPNAGRVVLAKPLYYTGNTIVIDHGLGLLSLFAHLSATNVEFGSTVTAGQIIGRVGQTGRVTGPHLHWSVRANGARVDPLSLIAVTK
jgi:murein DD-endopeptidase MepM/ murein hydrolase activator NlpD